jgi:hypothetical protein
MAGIRQEYARNKAGISKICCRKQKKNEEIK